MRRGDVCVAEATLQRAAEAAEQVVVLDEHGPCVQPCADDFFNDKFGFHQRS